MTTERYELVCKLLNCYASDADRETECPLIEIPPHGRLIYADVLKEQCKNVMNDPWNDGVSCSAADAYSDFIDDIDEQFTVIPADKEE
jgi:hypothetical protein